MVDFGNVVETCCEVLKVLEVEVDKWVAVEGRKAVVSAVRERVPESKTRIEASKSSQGHSGCSIRAVGSSSSAKAVVGDVVHEVRDEVGHETKVPQMCLGRKEDRGEVYMMENDQVGSQGRTVRCSLARPWRSTDVQVRFGVAGALASG